MEVGIEVEGPQVWLLGIDLTNDCDGAVRDSAPYARPGAPRRFVHGRACFGVDEGAPTGLRLPSESDSGLKVAVVTEFSSEGAAS
jgi:hypothetical protein